MLANRKMATPVLGMRRERDIEVPRHGLLRMPRPLPPEGETIERALIITGIGVCPLREGGEGILSQSCFFERLAVSQSLNV